MEALLRLLGLIALVISIVCFFRPIAAIGIPSRTRAGWLAVAGVVLLVLAGRTESEAPRPTVAESTAQLAIPDQQEKFLSIVDDFAEKYRAAPNDLAKGALRPQRAKAVCDLLRDETVRDWVGTVQLLSSNNEGKGVLDVSISRRANVTTWNNSLSDMSSQTLITPGTPLHDAALQLTKGQTVIFSGTFITGEKDCFREGSLTQSGSMTDPDWIFRFTAIRPYQ